MKHVDIRHIAVFAALVFCSTANAATYDCTAHYDDIHRPALAKARVDAQLQEDTATCDSAIGVQRATPSVNYRSCMLQHGWRYSFVTRTRIQPTRAPADPYFSTNARVAPGHFIDHDNGMNCQNMGGAVVCDPPNGTVHYFDPDQNLPCTRTGATAIKSSIVAKIGSHGFTIADIARSQQISESYIRQLFAEAGTTFTDCVLAERLARSHRMLVNPLYRNRGISAIAYDAGFGDVSCFNRTFRRRYGMTPSEVREAAQRPK